MLALGQTLRYHQSKGSQIAISSNRWPGRLRYVPMLNIGILIASIVTFGLAVSYARESIRTPMWKQALIYMRPRPANRSVIPI